MYILLKTTQISISKTSGKLFSFRNFILEAFLQKIESIQLIMKEKYVIDDDNNTVCLFLKA